METTLQLASWGDSTALRIPKIFLRQLNMTDKSTVKIKINHNNELIVTPYVKRMTIQERFAMYPGDYMREVELDWGEDVGEDFI
ncbi:MAG: AbrB family transcriptional regulator [Oscillospiraceae bacterium]|nr:AbrB family transcriptional regulator [Oscillospiraceae bacterium]